MTVSAPDDIAGLVSRLHCDDSFAAARLFPVIIKRRPFADPVLACNQQHRRRIHDRAGNSVIIFSGLNSPDANGVASLVAQLFFVKTQTHSFFGDEDELIVSGGKFRVDQTIVRLNLDGDDAAFADVGVIGKIRFFDDARAASRRRCADFRPRFDRRRSGQCRIF